MYFQKFSAQTRLLTLPAPHELPPREAQEYPLHHFCYLLVIYYNMSFLELPPPPQKKKLCLNLYKGNITILVNFLIKKKSEGRRRREVEISWYSQHMFWHWIFGLGQIIEMVQWSLLAVNLIKYFDGTRITLEKHVISIFPIADEFAYLVK